MQFLLEQSVGKRHSTVQGKWLNPYQCFANTKHLLPFELILITGDFRKIFFDVDYYSKLNRILDLIWTFTMSCKEVEVTLIFLNFFKLFLYLEKWLSSAWWKAWIKSNPTVLVTILIVNAENLVWWPALMRGFEMLLHHCSSGLALINETRPHGCCHVRLVFGERLVLLKPAWL